MADSPSGFKAAESYLAASLNLSDVTAATARTNLGLDSTGINTQFYPLSAAASVATGVTNTWYIATVSIPGKSTITGCEIKNGGTTNGNLRAALYSPAGTKLADRTSDLAQAGSINTRRLVPFDATYDAVPGVYFILIWFSSATATAFMCHNLAVGGTGTNATTTPTTVSASATMAATNMPVMRAY